MEQLILIAVLAVFLGGLTKSITGFGYAVTGTALLASFTSVGNAVVLMLPALIASNLELAKEKNLISLFNYLKELKYFAFFLVLGSVIGTIMIDVIPQVLLKSTVGALILLYILFKQEFYSFKTLSKFKEFCLRSSNRYQELLGIGSGVIFGSSNIGVVIVALVENMEENHEDFVAILSSLMILTITARFLTAFTLDLYSISSIKIALGLIVPGIAGIKSGEKIRDYLPDNMIKNSVLLMLAVISMRLILF
jgi:uncharacterized membrane protein YfcA